MYKGKKKKIAGVRLLMHAAHRLVKEDGQFACITACAAGGQVRTFDRKTNERKKHEKVTFQQFLFQTFSILLFSRVLVCWWSVIQMQLCKATKKLSNFHLVIHVAVDCCATFCGKRLI